MNNLIYVRRKRKIILTKKDKIKPNDIYVATLLKNVESLGFTLSEEIIDILETYSVIEIEKFYKELINSLMLSLGANVRYKPMYPNFPKQVMQATNAELYTNAFLHYLGDFFGVRILPKYRKIRRADLKDKIKLKVIELGNICEFNSIFTNLINSKTSISESDQIDLEWFVKYHKDEMENFIPKEIPLKENVALLGKLLTQHTNIAESFLKQYLKTATDILRFVSSLSGGDISLAKNTKFKNLKKKDRRLILSLLENCKFIIEDMLRYKEQWKRLGERLHPFEYKCKFPKCFEAFDIIRNEKPFSTFNRKIENFIIKKDINSLVILLKDRPGEFARRLDNILRLSSSIESNTENVLYNFSQIADKISSPVLLQVLTHFKHRNQNHDLRVFFPKGDICKVKAIDNNLSKINELVRQKVVEICKEKLIEKYKKLKPLGKVYLDKNLKKYNVPFALRSASKALKTIARGSKLDLPEGNTLRFFIWWKDGKNRTDLDISAVALDNNHKHLYSIAYYNLRGLGGYHSGDITSAPNGASEFIDIDIEKFLKSGIRYVLMSVNSFTDQPFCDLPECFAGFMVRQHPNSGEIYEPKTVENKIDVTTNTKICIPLIIDLKNREVIWTDIALKKNLSYANNVHNNMSSLTIISKAMTSLIKPTLYELFQLHIEARGEKIEQKKEADIIFSEREGTTPFDIEKIIAEFL